VIHRVWLGPKPIPAPFEAYAQSWRRHHPDWGMRLWTDATLPPLACQAEIDRARDFKSRYDMVRLEVLRQCGGVIIDMDMECLRPLDPLLGGVRAFVGRTTRGRRMGIQVLGAVPHHPLYERAIERFRTTAGVAPTASQESGPGFLTRLVADFPEGVTVLPRETFYSPLTIEPPKRPEAFPDLYAVHHHTESYREGPEGEIMRLERRLAEAQREILRLMDAVERAEQGRGSRERRDAKAQAKLERVLASRWWRLGRRLRVARLG